MVETCLPVEENENTTQKDSSTEQIKKLIDQEKLSPPTIRKNSFKSKNSSEENLDLKNTSSLTSQELVSIYSIYRNDLNVE